MELNQALSKVRKLIQFAEAPISESATDAERKHTLNEQKQARQLADATMLKFAIEEAMIRDARPAAEKSKPDILTVVVPAGDANWASMELIRLLARHCRCMPRFYTDYNREEQGWEAKIYGFTSDLRFFELLYTTVSLHMLELLVPTIQANLTLDANIYRLHRAGYDYRQIAAMYGWHLTYQGSDSLQHKDTGEVARYGKIVGQYRAAYKREVKRLGVKETRIFNAANYREDSSRGYLSGIRGRLHTIETGRTSGSEVVLKSSMDDLRDFYREEKPDQYTRCPRCEKLSSDPYKCEFCGQFIKDQPEVKSCPKCAANPSGHCRDHPKRGYGRDRVFNEHAYGAGVAHAKTADLTGNKVGGERTKLPS